MVAANTAFCPRLECQCGLFSTLTLVSIRLGSPHSKPECALILLAVAICVFEHRERNRCAFPRFAVFCSLLAGMCGGVLISVAVGTHFDPYRLKMPCMSHRSQAPRAISCSDDSKPARSARASYLSSAFYVNVRYWLRRDYRVCRLSIECT
jgi:hypothetical protein